MHNKKIPKNFLKFLTSILFAKIEPIIAPMIPKIIIFTPVFYFIFFSFKFTIIAVIAVGIKNIKFVAWAICC